jgi:hypothetical protein
VAAQPARAPVGQHRVAVGQPDRLMNAEELDARRVAVFVFPDDLPLLVNLAREGVLIAADQRVAVL